MSKFSTGPIRATAPIQTVSTVPDMLTGNSGPAYSRDPKSELFLLAVSYMGGEPTFYEGAGERDNRFTSLVEHVAATDPEWVARLIPFLRDEVNLRTAPIVAAAHYARVSQHNVRTVVSSAMQRADEPAEFVSYWRKFIAPRPLHGGAQRGVADAATRLYTERAAMRYNSHEHAMRMADVIELVHPKPKADWQSALFKWLLDERHHPTDAQPGELLAGTRAVRTLQAMPIEHRREHATEAVNMFASWEQFAAWLPGGMDKEAWEAVIPTMGYMALLRNLRNFDDAGVSDEVAERVAAQLSSPEAVASSRQFPVRFWSAFANVRNVRWHAPLNKALELSVENIPALSGHTLIMIDTSGSMVDESYWSGYPGYAKSEVAPWQNAAIFGLALAKRGKADVAAYGTQACYIPFGSGHSLVHGVQAVQHSPVFQQGTATMQILSQLFDPQKHTRVVILTDEQCDPHQVAPPNVPIYTFNYAGYKGAHLPTSRTTQHYTFAGATDASFKMMALLERGHNADWPF